MARTHSNPTIVHVTRSFRPAMPLSPAQGPLTILPAPPTKTTRYDPDAVSEVGVSECPGCEVRITVWQYQAWKMDKHGRLTKAEMGVHPYCTAKAAAKLGPNYFIGSVAEIRKRVENATAVSRSPLMHVSA